MRDVDKPAQGTGGTVDATVTYAGGGDVPTPPTVGPLERGAVLGRYVVTGPIGSGGMGAVYAAYDPELDRKVALKVLHPRHSQSAHHRARLQQRLAREAQALAKLNHPNVLTVFDVGTVGQRLFLATELVDGVTMRDWLQHDQPASKHILSRFRQAGEGLWAAHQAGLVHRDFKPANVMTTVDGRVLVLDFGLARPDRLTPDGEGPVVDVSVLDALPSASPTSAAGPAVGAMTHTGAAMGTPAYMAPEQHAGIEVGPEADQFSFCLSLWQALSGDSPFADRGSTVGTERAALGWGIVDTPASRAMPAHVRAALQRGLSARPDDRFPSMRVLLDALAADPWRLRRRLAIAVATLLAVGLSAFGVHQAVERRRLLCGGAASKLAGVWDDARSANLERIFALSAKPFAADTWRETERLLDRYSDAWASAHTETCAATQVRGEQSAELLDRRMVCLEQRRRELDALAGLLETGSDALIEAAVPAASRLTPVAVCADAAALLSTDPPPADADARAQVDALRARLAEAKAHSDAGDHAGGLALATPLVAESEALGYWPLAAESLFRLGAIQENLFNPEAAASALERAIPAAQAGGHDRVAAQALTRLVRVKGFQQADYDDGFRWGRMATSAIERLDAATTLQAELADLLGALYAQQGRYNVALAEHERALALKREALGPDHLELATTLARMGNVFYYQRLGEKALAYYRQGLAIQERVLGPLHPRVASSIARLGVAYMVMGDYDQALVEHERALALRQTVLAGDHVHIGNSEFDMGNALFGLRRYDDALARYEKALSLYQRKLGAEHRDVAAVLSNMAACWVGQGSYDDAREAYGKALAIRRAIFPADHPWIAETLGNLGQLERSAENPDAARAHYVEALAVVDGKEGSEHLAADMHAGLGASLVDLGRPTQGLEHLARATALRAALPDDGERRSEIAFARARALATPGWDGYEMAAACAAADQAMVALEGADLTDQEVTIAAWQANQDCPPTDPEPVAL